MTTAYARFFDGKTAKPRPVLLELTGQSLIVKSDGGNLLGEWPLDQLRDMNSAALTDEVRLSVGGRDPVRIVINDTVLIGELRESCPFLRKTRASEAGWWKSYLLWGGGAVVSIALIFIFILPLLATQIAKVLPESMRDDIGIKTKEFFIQSVARQQKISPDDVICMSGDGQMHLEVLLRALGSSQGEEPPLVKITVLKSSVPNAFALPGGQMLIFSGLIDMADDPNALAGVLAHELAHISHRHPSQLMVANAGIASVLSLLVGDVSGGTFMATMGKLVVGSAYSREFEREADQSGIEMMRSANFEIAPMIPLMEKLNKLTAGSTESIFALISSHPGGEERLELLRAAGKTGAQAMSPKAWAEVKGMCKE